MTTPTHPATDRAPDEPERDVAAYEVADSRSALRRWWERATYRPVIGDGEFLVRGVTRFSLLDRVLILLGRDVVTVVTTEAEVDLSDTATHHVVDTLRIEVGTRPRRYR